MATKVQTKRTTAPVATPKLGKNATFYAEMILPKQVGGKRKASEVVRKATAIAEKRQDRIVRVEYLFVAQGIASEREFGTPKMEKLRREVVNQRVPRKARVKAKKAAPVPRKRVARRSTKSTPAGSGRGKGSGSGRAAGRSSARSGSK